MASIASKHFPYASITGIDIFNHDSLSGPSMEKALQNMKELEIDKRVLLINHNLLTPFTMGTKFDLAMSNLVFHNLGKIDLRPMIILLNALTVEAILYL